MVSFIDAQETSMQFGHNMVAQNYWDSARFRSGEPAVVLEYPDHKLVAEALNLAGLVDDLGVDTIWSTEHHFSPHIMNPSLTQVMTFMVGRTKRGDIGTDVVVCPGTTRSTEEIAMLDIMLGERKMWLGRGAGADEFEGTRIPMSESRARFVECLEIIRRGLTQPRFSFAGEYYQIPKMEVRPRHRRGVTSQEDWRLRLLCRARRRDQRAEPRGRPQEDCPEQSLGRPGQVIQKIEALHQAFDKRDRCDVPLRQHAYAYAEPNIRLFGETVLPTVHGLKDLEPGVSAHA